MNVCSSVTLTGTKPFLRCHGTSPWYLWTFPQNQHCNRQTNDLATNLYTLHQPSRLETPSGPPTSTTHVTAPRKQNTEHTLSVLQSQPLCELRGNSVTTPHVGRRQHPRGKPYNDSAEQNPLVRTNQASDSNLPCVLVITPSIQMKFLSQ